MRMGRGVKSGVLGDVDHRLTALLPGGIISLNDSESLQRGMFL
jgi:hypothetical protein